MSALQQFDALEYSTRHRLITLFASGASFLDGYILIIIGVALESLIKDFNLTSWEAGFVSASTFVGLGVGTVFFGYFGDRIGRKKILSYNILLLAVCSVWSAFVTTPLELILMRFFIGVLIGGDYPIATSMVAEFSPLKKRAWSMGVIAAVWYVGGILASIVGYCFYDVDNSWRWMLASAAVPCLMIFFGRLNIPESPRWLLSQGRTEEAREVFAQFGVKCTPELLDSFKTDKVVKPSFKAICSGKNLESLLFVATIWICQIIPMFTIYFVGPQIMSHYVDMSPKEAFLTNAVISVAFFIGCFPAMWASAFIGRRLVCILSFIAMTAAMGVVYVSTNTYVLLFALMFYALSAGGPGILQWLYPNELFKTDIRATAVGVAMAITRVATIIATYGVYPMLEKYGSSSIVMSGVVLSLVGVLVSVKYAPETKHLSI